MEAPEARDVKTRRPCCRLLIVGRPGQNYPGGMLVGKGGMLSDGDTVPLRYGSDVVAPKRHPREKRGRSGGLSNPREP